MNVDTLICRALEVQLVASVQASIKELKDPGTLLRLAKASQARGVRLLRLEAVDAVTKVREGTGLPAIGLIKRKYEGFEPYITPTRREVDELLATGCEIIALDASERPRPDGSVIAEHVQRIHSAGRWVMADCDTVDAAVAAFQAGADIVGTTLSGFTAARPSESGPDLDLVREIRRAMNALPSGRRRYLFAEGRYEEPWQVEAALRAGADAVVVGGALNDPVKNTKRLMPQIPLQRVGAIDIGGTWIRGSVMGPADLTSGIEPRVERAPLPPKRTARIDWMRSFIERAEVSRVGISSAGVIWQNRVTLSKKFIPENQGSDYNPLRDCLVGADPYGIVTVGDGHASAWAHSCHPDFAGLDIVVLAIGTGLGFGHVREGKIVMGAEGLYSRLNDLSGPGGKTFEQLMGGFALTPNPSDEQKSMANEAIHAAIRMVSTFLFPDVVVVCGTVGMQAWLDVNLPPKEGWPSTPVVRSPYGADAGIYGAASVAIYPPVKSMPYA